MAQPAATHTWTATSNGTWSTAGNWTPGAPTSAAATVLQFNASGTTSYTATNDVANPFQLNGLILNSNSTGAVTLDGSPLQFVNNTTAGPVLQLNQVTGGPVALANNLLLTNDLTVSGTGTNAVTLSGDITGVGALLLGSAGAFTLSGNNNLWTGSTTLSRGALSLNYQTNNTDKLNAAGTLTFGSANGGTASLNILANAAANTSQSLTSTTFNAGTYLLNVGNAAGFSTTFNLGTLTRNSGSVVNLNLSGAGTSTVLAGGGANTVLGGVIVNGSDFGFHQDAGSGGAIIANTTYTTQNAAGSWAAGDNVTNNAGYTGTTTGGLAINSLRFNAAAASTVAVGAVATDVLTISSGGVLVTSTVGANASTLNAGIANALTGPYITTAAGRDLTLTNLSTGTLTINPNIGSSTSAPQAIVKSGSGAVAVGTAAMLYSANGIFVNQGTLSVGRSGAITAGTFDNSTYALRNPLGTTTAGVATTVTLGDGATLNANFGTAANVAPVFGNSFRVPVGTGTFSGTITSGTATAVINLGGVTLGDGATFVLGNGNSGQMRYQFAGAITVTGGAANQPTSATFRMTGGTFNTMTGAWVGTAGGTTLNLDLVNTTYTFSTATAPTNITRLNLLNNGRLYINNMAGIGTIPIVASVATFITTDQNATNTFTQQITLPSGSGIGSRQGTTNWNNPAGFPTTGTLILNNDNAVTTAMNIGGTYPALTGPMTFQIGGSSNATAGNAIGATTITNGLDATNAGSGGTFTLTANYSPGTASTSTPATTNLLTIGGNLALGANNLAVAGTGSLTITNVTTTGPGANSITKTGSGFLTLAGTSNAFTGGVNVAAAANLGIGASSTVTSGVLAGGPLGTGTLTLSAGSGVRDNNQVRTIHNNVVVNGNVTFSSTGTAGNLIFDDAGLTVPSTFAINAAANPTLTSSATVTLSQAITFSGGATGFTKAGTGLLTIDGDLPDTAAIVVSAGTLALTNNASTSATFSVQANAVLHVNGTSAAFENADNKVSLAPGAIVTRAATVDVTEFQQWLGTTGATDSVIALISNSADSYNFTGSSGRRLGSFAPGFAYSGTLTPDGGVLRLGGGGGTLVYTPTITGTDSLDVGLGGTSTGEVYLASAASTSAGGTTLGGATQLGLRNASSLGSGTVAFGTAGALLFQTSANTVPNAITTSSGGSIDNMGNALTLSGGISGAGSINLLGRGVTTVSGAGVTTTGAVGVYSGTITTDLAGGAPLGGGSLSMFANINLPVGGSTYTLANSGTNTFTYFAGTLSVGSATVGTQVTLGGTGASFVRGTNGMLVLNPANGMANLGNLASGERILVGGTAPTSTNGILTSSATQALPVFGRDTAANNNAGTFLNYGANGFVPASTYTTFSAGTITAGATTVADVNTTAAAVAASGTVYALRTNQNIAINNAATQLTISSGGLILNPTATANPVISGGTGQTSLATEGINFGASLGTIYTGGTGTNAAGGGATISAVINGTGGLAIAGPGQLTLSNTSNRYTGNVTVSGILAFAGFTDSTTATTATTLGLGGTRTLTLQGGTLRVLSGNYNPTGLSNGRAVQLGSAGGTIDLLGGATLQLDDVNNITSSGLATGPLTFTNSAGSGASAVNNTGNTNAVSGPIFISAATGGTISVNISGTGAFTTATNSVANAFYLGTGGTLNLQNTTSRSVVLQGGSFATSTGTGNHSGIVLVTTGGTIGGAGTMNLNGNIMLDGAGVTFGGTGTVNVNSVISALSNSSLGITKTATGTLNLLNANTYGGGTVIQAGTLVPSSNEALGAASGGVTFNTAAATFRFGTQFDLPVARTISINGVTGTFDSQALSVAINGPIVGSGTTPVLGKIGTGTLAITGTVTGSPGVTISAGTLNLASTSTPVFSTLAQPAASTLSVTESATFSGAATIASGTTGTYAIDIASGKTLQFTGNVGIGSLTGSVATTTSVTGAGTLSVQNSAANGTFVVGGGTVANNTTADFSGLGTLNINLSGTGSTIRVNPSNSTNTNNSYSVWTLAGSNTLTATNLNLGDSATNNGSTSQVNLLRLGPGANVLRADTINIGTGTRDLGQLIFAGANGSITVNAKNGTGAAVLNLGASGANTGVASAGPNLFDVTGHNATLNFAAVTIGTQPRATSYTSTLAFDTGTMTMASLAMATRTADTTNGAGIPRVTNANVNIGGGTVNITGGVLEMARINNSTTNFTSFQTTNNGTINITGGNVSIGNTGGTSISMGGIAAGGGTTAALAVNAALNISGGTTTLNGAIATRTASTGTSTTSISLTGGTLNMSGQNIAAVNNFTFTGGTLQDVGTLSPVVIQNGASSLLSVASNDTTLVSSYTLSAGTAQVATGRKLIVGASGSLRGVGGVSLTSITSTLEYDGVLSPGVTAGSIASFAVSGPGSVKSATGTYVVDISDTSADLLQIAASGTLDLAGAGDTLLVTPTMAITGPLTKRIVTMAGGYTTGDNTTNLYETVNVDLGFGVVVPAQSSDPLAANYVSVLYNANDIQLTVANLTPIPEPAVVGVAGAMAGFGLLRRRRRAMKR